MLSSRIHLKVDQGAWNLCKQNGWCMEGLEWQMYTYQIVRDYVVLSHDAFPSGLQDLQRRILDTETVTVSERGRPAQPLGGDLKSKERCAKEISRITPFGLDNWNLKLELLSKWSIRQTSSG